MVKLNKIYTRTGDDGTTGLVDGSRVSKAGALMAAIGDVDECNSAIGVARTHFSHLPFVSSEVEKPRPGESFSTSLEANGEGFAANLDTMLARIQNDLFDIGADLATPIEGDQTYALRVTAGQAEWLEQSIDRMNTALEPLKSFVLPAGEPGAAALHLARAISRRAERAAVAASENTTIRPEVLIYLNRLSDFLFVAARAVNQSGAGDVLWVPGASR